MVHVKRSTLSNQLSHLFNQGANSCELIRLEPESLNSLQNLIEAKAGTDADTFLEEIKKQNTMVRYAIVTHKDVSKKSDNLPLFSRISLMRSLRTLKAMGVEAKVCYIKDNSTPKPGKKKTRKKKAATSVQATSA